MPKNEMSQSWEKHAKDLKIKFDVLPFNGPQSHILFVDHFEGPCSCFPQYERTHIWSASLVYRNVSKHITLLCLINRISSSSFASLTAFQKTSIMKLLLIFGVVLLIFSGKSNVNLWLCWNWLINSIILLSYYRSIVYWWLL